jgi:hypothetical protein
MSKYTQLDFRIPQTDLRVFYNRVTRSRLVANRTFGIRRFHFSGYRVYQDLRGVRLIRR